MPSTTRRKPFGLQWRSSTTYTIATAASAMFSDLFLYSLIIPIIPFILSERLNTPHDKIQQDTSILLAFFAGASVIFSLPVGYAIDQLLSRQAPFLFGLFAMFASTALLWQGKSWIVLVIARILQGFSGAVVWTVGLSMILDTVGSRRLGVVLSTVLGFICVGDLIAPVVGGVVYEQLGEKWVFVIAFTILSFDFLVRILVIEKNVVKRNEWDEFQAQDDTHFPNETTSLITGKNNDLVTMTNSISESDSLEWELPSNTPYLLSKFPILYLIATSPRLMASLLLFFTYSMNFAVFDATVPIQGLDLFSFNSRSAGLLFIPLLLPCLIVSPVVGMAVDRYGTKLTASSGLLLLSIPLSLLNTVHAVSPGQEGYHWEVTKLCILLTICGISLASINSQSVVEESYVIERYEKANPEFFVNGGPYAQIYAINNMVYGLGLTIGPIFAGYMKVKFGYAVMNYYLASWCVIVSILCFLMLGGKPKK